MALLTCETDKGQEQHGDYPWTKQGSWGLHSQEQGGAQTRKEEGIEEGPAGPGSWVEVGEDLKISGKQKIPLFHFLPRGSCYLESPVPTSVRC